MIRVLVVGSEGQLGSSLNLTLRETSDAQFQVETLGRSFDLTGPARIVHHIRQFRPDWIVNCAAMTDVDAAERNASLAFKVNAESAFQIAAAATEIGSRSIYISTEAVFCGKTRAPRRETDVCNPPSVYGVSKLAGENLVRIADPTAVVVRTSWLYGRIPGRNFPSRIRAQLYASGDSIRVVTDVVGNPTSVNVLSAALEWIMRSGVAPGLYHVASTGSTSKFEWACELAKHWQMDPRRIVPATTRDFPTLARRPEYVDLDCSKFLDIAQIALPTWREDLTVHLTTDHA